MRRKMPPRWRTRTRWPREAVARPRRVAPGFPYPEPGAAVAAPGFNVEIKIAPLPPSARRQRGGRASALHAVQPSAPAGAGKVSMAPRRNGRGLWGYAPACCGRLHESVPSSTLAVQINHITKDGPRTRRPATPMELPRHASSTLPPPATRGVLALSLRVGLAHVRAQAGVAVTRGAESATSPFGTGRPLRPCLVVNPGGGAAAPWASWPQPCSENNFPCAARIPRGTNSFRFQVLHVVATAVRCDQPIPRRPDHNKDALARPCSTRKEKHHG